MLTDDGSRTLVDRRLDETFHSGCGALSECLHVYLRNSGIEALLEPSKADRNLSACEPEGRHLPVRVLEFGFGTGMAALLTMAAAKSYRRPMEYVSLERELLPREVLEQLEIGKAVTAAIDHGRLPPRFAAASQLENDWLEFRASLELAQRSNESSKVEEIVWDAGENVHLRLIIGDAIDYLARLKPKATAGYDAIYFDAFSPATNPEAWTYGVFKNLANLLNQNGLLVSYCVNGQVRRGLEQAGFEVKRIPGPSGGKREVLAARRANFAGAE